MFPFRFDYFDIHDDFDQEIIMQRLQKNWIPHIIDASTLDGYNQYNYFNAYARDILYSNNRVKNTKSVSCSLKRVIENSTFVLRIPNNKETYKLKLENVFLNMFSIGVGIMSIEVSNYNYTNFEDVLNINDFGRKIYPLFLVEGKNFYMPDEISINGVSDNFIEQKRSNVDVGKHIISLLGDVFTQRKRIKEKYTIEPLLEDKMYVFSWCGDEELSKQLSNDNMYLKNDNWYKYVYVDADILSISDENMRKEQIEKATYTRWKSDGTLYGTSNYSFVCLTNRSSFANKTLYAHMRTLYFNMILILLTSKASIIKFSDSVVTESDFKHNSIEKLYKEYLTFYSKLNLHEVSYQNQAMELHSFVKEYMEIDYLTEKLDDKFTKLFDYTQMKREEASNERLMRISKLGAIFLPPTLMAGIYGMNIYDFRQDNQTISIALVAMLMSSFLGYFTVTKQSIGKWISMFLTVVLISGATYWIGSKIVKKTIKVPIVKKMPKTLYPKNTNKGEKDVK